MTPDFKINPNAMCGGKGPTYCRKGNSCAKRGGCVYFGSGNPDSRYVHILPDQPPPTPSTGDVWAEVLAAVPMTDKARAICEERRQTGIERYGTPLQRDNNRNHLTDAMQELADAVVYLWADGEEREAREVLRILERLSE